MGAQSQLLSFGPRPQARSPLRYARRLLEMEPVEIAARARERVTAPGPPPRWEMPPARVLERRLEEGFLYGPRWSREIAEAWLWKRPPAAARVIEMARRGLERWEIFGVPVRLEPGTVDWHSGDLRWVWELNRQQYLFAFGRAYALTGDERLSARVHALVRDWRAKNPYGRGPNWSSALEVGVRALSWLWTLPLVWPEEAVLAEWMAGLYEHYQYLRAHLSLYTDATNHLIGEAAALWILSVALPDLPEAAREQRRALSVLAQEVERQVTADGVNREQSTGYQRFVLDFCLQVLALARRTGRRLPAVLAQRTEAMGAFLALLGGRQAPSIGDGDGGRGAPFAEPDPDLEWWLGVEKTPPATPGVFREGGYCYWEAGGAGLLFDVGPLGLWPHASHGHADALSVLLRVGDRWILGDPGTGAYGSCPDVRDALRGTAAHNTVAVDGLDQSDPLEVFKWARPVPTQLAETYSDARYHYARAVHGGYRRLREPVVHSRSVLFVRPARQDAGWILMDRLEGRGKHRFAMRFHFPPGVELIPEGVKSVIARDLDGRAALRLAFSDEAWRIESGLWSHRFGQWEEAPVIAVERTAETPLVWLTFLTALR